MSGVWRWPVAPDTGGDLVRQVVMDAQLRKGDHVHRMVSLDDEQCLGGDHQCPLFGVQLEEAMEAWSVS